MLYTLSCSPAHCDLPVLLRLFSKGDDLLLLQNGVLAGITGSASLTLLLKAPITLYALRDDLDARGLSGYISHRIMVVSYTHFVKLTEKHNSQVAWQ